MVAEDKGLRVEESFANAQTVELFAMVAISRETSTSTDGCDSCSGCKEKRDLYMYSGTDSCGGCEKRDKYTDSCRGCNQSRPRLHWKVLFTRVWPNIVSLYNPFTRNCYSTTYTSPYKFLPVSALEWLFNQRRGTRIYALTAQTVQKFSQWSCSSRSKFLTYC